MTPEPRLRDFVTRFSTLLTRKPDETTILRDGADLLRDLISHDDWLPDALSEPDPERYRQNLLYCDGLERFSVVSFVWGPGQSTPIHNHTVWGLIGMLRGAEWNQRYRQTPSGGFERQGSPERLEPGAVEAVSPTVGDVHQVRNAFDDRASISIHVYGANIGAVRRAVFDPTGMPKPFISGYSNASLPNIWDRSGNGTRP